MSFFCKDCEIYLKDGREIIEHLADNEGHRIFTTVEDKRY